LRSQPHTSPHWHCGPQAQFDGAIDRQPQLQLAPGQGLQGQVACCVSFIRVSVVVELNSMPAL
jgi:hypothetical protein